jgi:hypothetical protein
VKFTGLEDRDGTNTDVGVAIDAAAFQSSMLDQVEQPLIFLGMR